MIIHLTKPSVPGLVRGTRVLNCQQSLIFSTSFCLTKGLVNNAKTNFWVMVAVIFPDGGVTWALSTTQPAGLGNLFGIG